MIKEVLKQLFILALVGFGFGINMALLIIAIAEILVKCGVSLKIESSWFEIIIYTLGPLAYFCLIHRIHLACEEILRLHELNRK